MNKKVQIQDLGLKDYKDTWDYQEELFQGILDIKSQNRKDEANQKETLKIKTDKLRKYFPKGTTPKQMEETIIKLLERELQKKRNRDSR